MPQLRYLIYLLAAALLTIWVVGAPGGPVGSALSKTRGAVDPRVGVRAEATENARRQVTYAIHRNFATFIPLVEIHDKGDEMQLLVPSFMFEAPDTAKAVMEGLMITFIDAPGMRLRVHAPSDMGEEERLRLWRLTDKAVALASIPNSSLDFSQAPAAPGGWVTFIFTTGFHRHP